MSFPIARLVAARLRRRGASTALLIVAVAAAVALVTLVGGIALVAADATIARSLSANGVDRPVIEASRFEPSSEGSEGSGTFAGHDARIREAFGRVDRYVGAPVAGVMFSPLSEEQAGTVQVLAVDDPATLTELADGRLPAPCSGDRCEALLLSAQPRPDLGATIDPATGLALDVVGRGLLVDAVPFGVVDQRGEQRGLLDDDQTVGGGGPALLLVRGAEPIAGAASPLARIARTYFWSAPVDPASIHPWNADQFEADVAALAQDTIDDYGSFTILSPASIVTGELARAEAARGRLLLLGSLGVAILLAFAVFASLVNRPDVTAEHRRLVALGANRRQRTTFIVLEAAIPSVVGGMLGWAVVAFGVALLAISRGADPAAVVTGALLSPGAVAVTLAVVGAAIAAIAAGTAPGLPRGGLVRIGATVAVTATVILGWQLAGSGALQANALGAALASPIVVLLPPVTAFLVALALLLVVPPLLRRLARSARRAPLPVRLSLLSVARQPERPAATLTLLAFSLGAIVFALGYATSLDRGIKEQAAYRTAADLRVVELGTGLSISQSVVPTSRYEQLGDGVTAWPVARTTAEVKPVGRVDVVAVPADALDQLRGWRSDFSSLSPAELAGRIRVEGDWQMAGQALPAEATQVRLRFDYVGEPTRLSAIVATEGGDFARLEFGVVNESTTSVAAALPESARGGTLVALVFGSDRLIAGSGHQGELRRATVTFEGIPGLVPDQPRDIEVFTVTSPIVRAPQATDGRLLPAVVSPDLAAAADADGRLRLSISTGAFIDVEVVGVADHLPTVMSENPSFALLDLDPFLLAWNAALPGAGRPTEMWLRLDDPALESNVRAALAAKPFRFAEVESRSELIAGQAADPLAEAIVGTLLAAAIAGLILSLGGLLMGALVDLRDESGELADLEAQGLAPSALKRQVLVRTVVLAGGGVIAGVVVGIVLTQVTTRSLALTAGGGLPIPPLQPEVPFGAVVLVVGAVLGITLAAIALLAVSTYGGTTLGERRSDGPAARAAVPAEGDGGG